MTRKLEKHATGSRRHSGKSPSEGTRKRRGRPEVVGPGRGREEGTTIMSPLTSGVQAPDFTLQGTLEGSVSLEEFRGRPVILAFYPADWSPVCSDQLALYNEVLPEFERYGAQLLGISVDGIWSHRAFAKDRKLRFPILADFEPKGQTALAYGAYRIRDGFCERALFVLDKEGRIHWSYVSPVGVNPGADGILAALDDLQSGGT